jgi:hypothetical protein
MASCPQIESTFQFLILYFPFHGDYPEGVPALALGTQRLSCTVKGPVEALGAGHIGEIGNGQKSGDAAWKALSTSIQ